MKKIKSIRHSLKLKTSLITVTVIVISMTLCGALLTNIVEKKLKEETIGSEELNAQLMSRHIEDQLYYLRQAYFSIYFDSQIQDYVLHPEDDLFYQNIGAKIDTVLMSSNYNIYSIYLTSNSTGQIYTTDFRTWQDNNDPLLSSTLDGFVSPEVIVRSSFSQTSNDVLVSLTGQIYQENFGDPIGWLSVNTQLSVFTHILEEDFEDTECPRFIVDQDNNIITSYPETPSAELLQAALNTSSGSTVTYNDDEWLVISSGTDIYQWKYYKLIPEDEIFKEVYQLLEKLIVILLLFCVAVFISMFQTLNYITDPIYDLSEKVRSYRQHNQTQIWNGSFRTNRKDEFAYLYESLQDMTTRIDRLIDEEYKSKLYKKETQIRIYRNGINPHFLYNILDSIVWTIKFGNYEQAETILMNLSVFLHHVLNSNKEFISVSSMHEELSTYCTLASFLKDDSIQWSVEFDPAAKNWRVPSFLIQPLAENCFKHAFTGREKGSIQIRGVIQDDFLVFTVKDDGNGMSEEQVASLLNYLDNYDFERDTEHFGLASVHQRLKLYYGSDSGLIIKSSPGAGTVITVRLPVSKLSRDAGANELHLK